MLCVLVSLPWATKLTITLSFFSQQDYIAENLCENKDQPELECNGKCILMQKLKMAEEPQPNSQPIPEILQFELSGYVTQSESESPSFLLVSDRLLYFNTSQNLPTTGYYGDIFHPPRKLS